MITSRWNKANQVPGLEVEKDPMEKAPNACKTADSIDSLYEWAAEILNEADPESIVDGCDSLGIRPLSPANQEAA
jgi:uncharacterized protein involved in tolerance to divalent cations